MTTSRQPVRLIYHVPSSPGSDPSIMDEQREWCKRLGIDPHDVPLGTTIQVDLVLRRVEYMHIVRNKLDRIVVQRLTDGTLYPKTYVRTIQLESNPPPLKLPCNIIYADDESGNESLQPHLEW